MMDNNEVREAFLYLNTPAIADACRKLNIPLRAAPIGATPISPEMRLAGRAFPARYYGSLDIVIEAIDLMELGEVLVLDNGGRTDAACVGNLTVLEAHRQKLSGMFVWGCHRDSAEIRKIGLAVFSYGRCPHGPLELHPRPEDALAYANIGEHQITQEDFIFADEDGVLFVPYLEVDNVILKAREVINQERHQVLGIYEGKSLRQQFQFDDYLEKRKDNPDYTFADHLKEVDGTTGE